VDSLEWELNRDKYVQKMEDIKNFPKDGDLCLHLGCGEGILDKWINIDKYYEDPRVIKKDIYLLNYPENSVDAIYSSHSLEHLPVRHARLALKNWVKILKPGGKLFLAIPDLEETMRCILNKDISFLDRYTWFLHVLFGYQASSSERDLTLDSPVDYGQFHTCGFTEELIVFYLLDDGYDIIELYHYNGWDTPSMYIEAVKK